MSLYSVYREAISGCPVPVTCALNMVESLKDLPLPVQEARIRRFCRQAVRRFTDYDLDEAFVTILPDYVPEDDPFVVALRERRIPLHCRMAFIDYVSSMEYSKSCSLRQRLARELEATYPLQKWAKRLRRQQQGCSESEKQRLELKALLERQALLEASDPELGGPDSGFPEETVTGQHSG